MIIINKELLLITMMYCTNRLNYGMIISDANCIQYTISPSHTIN